MKEVKPPRKPLFYYYGIALVVLLLINFLLVPLVARHAVQEVDYGTFMTMTENKEIGKVEVEDNQIIFTNKDGSKIYKTGPMNDPDLTQRLYDAGAEFTRDIVEQTSPLLSVVLTWVLPIVLFIAVGQLMAKKLTDRAGGPGSMMFGAGKSNAKIYVQSSQGIRFADVAGEDEAKALLAQETPKVLDRVATQVTGSVRELCSAAANACRELGYEPVILTDRLCCEAREAGSFLGSIARTHAGQGKKLAFLAGGETVVHLTGTGLGGRNQELALAAAPVIAGLDAAVFSVGSDGTDGPTDAAGGYVDGSTAAALAQNQLNVYDVLQNNDAYHALKAVDGLIITGVTGTNVNDVAVVLIGNQG